jgi:hypothetical protein
METARPLTFAQFLRSKWFAVLIYVAILLLTPRYIPTLGAVRLLAVSLIVTAEFAIWMYVWYRLGRIGGWLYLSSLALTLIHRRIV